MVQIMRKHWVKNYNKLQKEIPGVHLTMKKVFNTVQP